MTPSGKRVALVLGGGGLKGLAHLGVIRVLEALKVEVDEYIGVSVGAVIGALAAGGMRFNGMLRLWNTLRRDQILDLNSLDVMIRGTRAPSLYRGQKLHDWLRAHLPRGDFSTLSKPLYVGTVELNTGVTVYWGAPGFTACPVHEAVLASCAIPGLFPPRRIGGYHYIDGATVDSLPVGLAIAHRCDAIVAVHLQYLDFTTARPVHDEGVVSIIGRASTIIGHTMADRALGRYPEAPIVVIRPRVADHGVLEFAGADRLLREGLRAAHRVLAGHPLLV
jgi:NTE family protein